MKRITHKIFVALGAICLIIVIAIPLPVALMYIWSFMEVDFLFFLVKIWATGLICLVGIIGMLAIYEE